MVNERVIFKKGKQRKFLKKCIENLNLTSLRGLLQLGLDTNYNNLKNFHTERRALPRQRFEDLVYLAKIDINKININYKDQNWGQIKGGKTSKKQRND
tara:strand:+ start:2008 stop:2301 length:294 start_codon:yes stop_codon:yes gene_type:complete